MPLGKKDNPAKITGPDDAATEEAVQDVLDEGAGAPVGYEEAAEALPEKDEVQEATKDGMLADTGQEEAEAKLRAVEASPDALDTPSGHALKETAHIADNVERGEAYARAKSQKRWGYVTPDLQEK